MSLSIIGLLGASKFWRQREGRVIEYTKKGYSPNELSVEKGETIKFVNKSENYFWPASDIHPSHQIYPEFDPQKPIKPGQSWTFRFEKSGIWEFHDHLAPYFTGKITVLDEKGEAKSAFNCEDVKNFTRVEKENCWGKVLTKETKENGIAAAFAYLKDQYGNEPIFTEYCHLHAHLIGDVAYSIYKTERNLEALNLTADTVNCGYGFFHGFLEHLFRDDPDIEKAKEFCELLDKKFSDEMPRMRLNCYHGMGHGFMPEPPDFEKWGNLQEMIAEPLIKCGQVSSVRLEVTECLQGIFNVAANWMVGDRYGLSMEASNPMAACASQPVKEHQMACYYELSMRISSFADDDIRETANLFVDDIKDDDIARMVIHSMSSGVIQRAQAKDNDEYLIACYSLSDRLQTSCMTGLIGGFVAHGEPGKEYVKAIPVCASKDLPEKDRTLCYSHLFNSLKGVYTREELEDICQLIDARFREFCFSNQQQTSN